MRRPLRSMPCTVAATLRARPLGLVLATALALAGPATAQTGQTPTSGSPPRASAPVPAPPHPKDTMAQRALACTACHGPAGRAGPDGYYPRLAGKPAGYLAHQLINFREGRRRYGPMVYLVDHLSDDYLHEIARHFADQDVPYPPPERPTQPAPVLEHGRRLVFQGDPARRLPACASCHGQALTGVQPAIPGLIGLPRHYLAAQLGAWHNGQRRAQAPDCMADVARRLTPDDVSAVTAWLASQPWPPGGKPALSLPSPLPVACGGVPAAGGER